MTTAADELCQVLRVGDCARSRPRLCEPVIFFSVCFASQCVRDTLCRVLQNWNALNLNAPCALLLTARAKVSLGKL